MTIEEVINAIRNNDFSVEDLREINSAAVRAIKLNREVETLSKISHIQVGDTVKFNDTVKPKLLEGFKATVTKVNRKTVVCDIEENPSLGYKWNGATNVKVPVGIIDIV